LHIKPEFDSIILVGEEAGLVDRRAHLAGVGFAVIFGLSFMFSKTALQYLTPLGLLSYRFLIAFLGFEFLRLTGVIKIKLSKQKFGRLSLVAIFQPILYFLFETFGLSLTTSSEAAMVTAAIPIFVALLGALVSKEKPTPLQVVFILVSVAGIIMTQALKSSGGITGSGWGFVFLLLAVLSAACFNIVSRKAAGISTPFEVTYVMMFLGAVTFNLIYLIQLLVEDRIGDYLLALRHAELILPLLYLGLIASVGGFFLVNYSLGRLPAHVSSIYANLSTIVTIGAGALILREQLEYYHYLGSALILIGVYGTVRFARNIEAP
jgi:drug/metabolite transporter (DMT)-like permease